ncbi:MAG: HAD family hydrolase [Phycisphaerales bacterium]|nr:MAG: HAD family hydrolase [Phycisphaerales bacterium]
MRFIIEFEGVLVEVADAWYEAFSRAVRDVGWSKLEKNTFWRLMRAKGLEGNYLPGARPIKNKTFSRRFMEHIESDDVVSLYQPRPEIVGVLRSLRTHGPCSVITRGISIEKRDEVLERAGLRPYFEQAEAINTDPRKQPGELKALSQGDERTVAAASSDAVIRAAREAELFAAGVSSGACNEVRLQRAGADIVYRKLGELADSLARGATDLIRAGLLPPPYD